VKKGYVTCSLFSLRFFLVLLTLLFFFRIPSSVASSSPHSVSPRPRCSPSLSTMRLNSAVALSLALPLSVHAHNSLRSLNPSHRHLAARDVVVTPELVTSIDSPLPSTITPSENATTVLIPVDPSTVSRIDSALPNPSKSITLYYAEASYTDGAHYKSVIEWDMNWPALVLGDAPQVESFTCGLDGKILTFNDKDAFEEALDWDFPLVLGEFFFPLFRHARLPLTCLSCS